jgi:hypothetical protein
MGFILVTCRVVSMTSIRSVVDASVVCVGCRLVGLFIPDPDPDFLHIPDPGVKRHQIPDPGSGSATLYIVTSNNIFL